MSSAIATLLLAAEKSPADEGRDIVASMLVVGLVFLGVIVIGQSLRYLSHRRAERKRAHRAY